MVEPTDLESWRLLRQLTTENAARQPGVAGGGGGPHDPGMEPRVAALEAGQQRLELAAARIEAVLGRMDERMASLASKADVVKVEGAVSALDAKVTALDGRVGRVEATVATALATAVGKAIGPVQFVAMLGTAIVIFGAAVTAYRWLGHQPWFAS